LRNAIVYIPPILFEKQMPYFYPFYRDAFEDEEYETFLDNQLDIISSEKKSYTSYGNNILAMDSWFPNLAFNKGIVQGFLAII
jgi:predicted metal-dependent HD superfamily phosphohydrolase